MNVALHARGEPAGDALHVLSLCTGGGGLDLAVELACPGARIVGMVEGEAFAVAVLVAAMQAGLLAPCPVWSDARTFRGRPWRGGVDLLTAGYPCQPFSLAGRRRAHRDPRHLWPHVRRIAVQSGAWALFLENVGGHLSLGFEQVRRELLRLGFEVEAGLFTAAEVGFPQDRERLFILAVADARRDGRRQGSGALQPRPVEPVPARGGEGLALAHGEGRGGGEPNHAGRQEHPAAERGGGPVALADLQRGEARLDAGLDAEAAGRGALAHAAAGGAVVLPFRGGRRGRADEPVGGPQGRAAAQQPGPGGELPLHPPGPGDLAAWSAILARSPQRAPALSDAHGAARAYLGQVARLGPPGDAAEAERRLRRVADGLARRVDQLRMLGNGVVPLQGAYALRTLGAALARRSPGAAELVRLMEAGR